MSETGGWKASLEKLKRALDNMQATGDSFVVPESTLAAFGDFGQSGLDVNVRLHIMSQLDVDRVIAVCRQSDLSWWGVFTARAFDGDLEGMRKVYMASKLSSTQNNEKPSPTVALKWISETYTLEEVHKNTIKPEVIRQLIEWGAQPNDDNGKWLEKSLRQLDADCIRELVDGGANPETVFRVMGDLQEKKQYDQVAKIQAALSRKNLYFRVDEQTLMESKYIPDVDGGSSFKTLFNFRARRVTEIYEYGQDRKAVMTGVPFSEYDQEMLGFAREELVRLGGKPRDGLGKQKIKGLSS